MEYLQAMRAPDYRPEPESKKLRWGCSAVGWVFFALVLILCALFVVKFFNYYQKIKSDGYIELPQATGSMTPRDGIVFGTVQQVVPDSELVTDYSSAYGADPEKAKLIIVEFGDFGCAFCKQESLPLRRVVEQHKDQVRLVYRHYSSESVNPNGLVAAQAAECAGEQGKFWPMYDKLYVNAPALGFDDLVRYASELGLQGSQFEICLSSERYLKRVERDIAVGKSLGISGTPTLFFNGQRVVGALPEDSLQKVVDVFLSMDK